MCLCGLNFKLAILDLTMTETLMVEENKALVTSTIEEIWNKGNLNSIKNFISPHFVSHHPRNRDEDIHGIEAYKNWIVKIRSAFPDITFEIVNLFANDNQVMFHLRGKATHAGNFGNVAPTYKGINTTVTGIVRLVDKKIAECWGIVDFLAIEQQLGVIAPIG